MSLLQLFITAFKDPRKLLFGKDKGFGKTFLYLFILSIFLMIPIGLEASKVIKTFQKEIETITSKLPDFEVENNTLKTDKKDVGFIYQTDSFIFTFDPEGKRDADAIQGDLIGNVMGLGLLKHELVFSVTDDHLLASFLPRSLLTLPYSKFDNSLLTKTWISKQLTNSVKNTGFIAIICLVTLIPIMIDLAFNLLTISLLANIWCLLKQGTLKFSDTFKIMIYSATLPTVLATVLSFFSLSISPMMIIMFLTFMIYMRVASPTFTKTK